ncbi:hypothetical protein AK812_SmicGene17667 [Symbiodinium microadriaticum]|uniref:EF-hand domain-containing protein n=1 Tax=Symbiodinium microadriaticum TaxID=2951 RepID=A0A1Q9DX66_SYMMI|nr:hypothetical protein AK812_SmicGene17667 [Symbiodinium microadriaticum]
MAAPFVGRCRERCEAAVPQEITEQSSSLPSLHGDLRDLAYLALARASAEAELNEDVVLSASAHIQWGPDSKEGSRAYLGQLARGMAGVPPAFWCKNTSFCADQIRLAFRYLDVDADGMLSAMDLAYHIDSEISKSLPIAGQWLQHWSQQNPRPSLRQRPLRAAPAERLLDARIQVPRTAAAPRAAEPARSRPSALSKTRKHGKAPPPPPAPAPQVTQAPSRAPEPARRGNQWKIRSFPQPWLSHLQQSRDASVARAKELRIELTRFSVAIGGNYIL